MSQKYLQRFCQGAFKWNLGFDESALVLPEIVLVPESQYFESGTLSGIDSIGCGECTAAESGMKWPHGNVVPGRSLSEGNMLANIAISESV